MEFLPEHDQVKHTPAGTVELIPAGPEAEVWELRPEHDLVKFRPEHDLVKTLPKGLELSELEREVFVDIFLGESTISEVVVKTGATPIAVYESLHSLNQKLKNQLNEYAIIVTSLQIKLGMMEQFRKKYKKHILDQPPTT
jgi:hypothetical protein